MRPLSLITLLTLVLSTLFLSACGSIPKENEPEYEELDEEVRVYPKRRNPALPAPRTVGALQSQLGMNRKPSDLGYSERPFNPCVYGLSDVCAEQYLTVIHFQLLCRDSEGTVSAIPKVMPVVSRGISWSLAGQTGGAPTDRNGYGRVTLVSPRPLRSDRLVIRKGHNYVGVSANDISKIVLPKNWCPGGA